MQILVLVADVIGGIMFFRKDIMRVLKPVVGRFVLNVRNSRGFKYLFQIFTVICGVSFACILVFGPLNIELPATICMVIAFITAPVFLGSLFMKCDFLRKRGTSFGFMVNPYTSIQKIF